MPMKAGGEPLSGPTAVLLMKGVSRIRSSDRKQWYISKSTGVWLWGNIQVLASSIFDVGDCGIGTCCQNSYICVYFVDGEQIENCINLNKKQIWGAQLVKRHLWRVKPINTLDQGRFLRISPDKESLTQIWIDFSSHRYCLNGWGLPAFLVWYFVGERRCSHFALVVERTNV